MSSRPKPITGTFYPDAYTFGWGDILGPSATLEDLMAGFESGGGTGHRAGSRTSTESLTSILYHDSFDEADLPSTDEDEPQQRGGRPQLVTAEVTAANPATPGAAGRPRLKPALPDEATRPLEVARRLNGSGGPAMRRKVAPRKPRQPPAAESPAPSGASGVSSSAASAASAASESKPRQRRRTSASADSATSAASVAETSSVKSDEHRTGTSTSASASVSGRSGAGSGLSWETWFLAKERRLREQRQREAEELQRRHAEQTIVEDAKKEKAAKGREAIDRWLEAKRKKQLRSRAEEKQKAAEAESKKKEEKEKLEGKSKVAVKDWQTKYREKQDAARQKAKAEKDAAEQRDKEKKAKADAAFAKWLAAHKDVRPHAPYSYGYTDGRLMTYYDKNSNPPPSFVNSEPWLPPAEILRREHR